MVWTSFLPAKVCCWACKIWLKMVKFWSISAMRPAVSARTTVRWSSSHRTVVPQASLTKRTGTMVLYTPLAWAM